MMRIFFCVCYFLSFSLSAQELQDSTLSRFHFNLEYDYEADTLLQPPYNSDSLLHHASQLIGTPYFPNGKEPGGFDCSGFTFYNFKRFGIYLPYYSFQQAEIGHTVGIDQARPGDLILFKGHDPSSIKAGHVGIVSRNLKGRIQFIHASTSHGVRYDYIDTPYFKERFISIQRIVE